jgi:hypothetical protein
MTSDDVTAELVSLLQAAIPLIQEDKFDTVLYQALGALHEYTVRHAGLAPPPESRPSYQKSEMTDVLASGWIEEMAPPRKGGKQVAWREVLALLVQKENEEPCLWITREIFENEEAVEPELETMHRIPMRRLQACEYVDFYGDHRIAIKVKRRDYDLIFRCKTAQAAQSWAHQLEKAKSKGRKSMTAVDQSVELEVDENTGEVVNVNQDEQESPFDEKVPAKSGEEIKPLADRLQDAEDIRRLKTEVQQQESAQEQLQEALANKQVDQTEMVRQADEERRRKEHELEIQKKALAEQRRKDLERQRKALAEEQKRKEAEEKRRFLEQEQRKLDLKARALASKGSSGGSTSSLTEKLNNQMSALEADRQRAAEEERAKQIQDESEKEETEEVDDPDKIRKRIAEQARQKLVLEEAERNAAHEKERLEIERLEKERQEAMGRQTAEEKQRLEAEAWAHEFKQHQVAQQQPLAHSPQPTQLHSPPGPPQHPFGPHNPPQQQQRPPQQQWQQSPGPPQPWNQQRMPGPTQQQIPSLNTPPPAQHQPYPQQQLHPPVQQFHHLPPQQQRQPPSTAPHYYGNQQFHQQNFHQQPQYPPQPQQHPPLQFQSPPPLKQSNPASFGQTNVVRPQPHYAQPEQTPTAPPYPGRPGGGMPQPQHAPTAFDMKYSRMVEQTQDDSQAAVTNIRRNVLMHWALQPPTMQILRPLDQLICSIHTVFPPAFGMKPHDYYDGFDPVSRSDLMNAHGTAVDEEKVKKAVRKVRFFLHPDKRPKDLNDEQQYVTKMLWDVVNDAWEDHKKAQEELDWVN